MISDDVVSMIKENTEFVSQMNSVANFVIFMTYDYSVQRQQRGPNAPIKISFVNEFARVEIKQRNDHLGVYAHVVALPKSCFALVILTLPLY